MSARAWSGKGMKYEARLLALNEGGKVTTTDAGLAVSGADAVTLLLTAATDYRGKDPTKLCDEQLTAASKKSYTELRAAHVADYRKTV